MSTAFAIRELLLIGVVLLGMLLAGCDRSYRDSASPALHNGDVSFAGERVRIVVNFGAGGGTDLYARTLAPFLAKYLPGHPTIVIENKPGGDGVLAAAYTFRQARPDGLTVCLCNGLATRWATRKDFGIDVLRFGLIGSTQENSVVMVWSGLDITEVGQLSGYTERLLLASPSPIAPPAIRTRLLFDQIGVSNFKIIGGYPSSSKSFAATSRGETNMSAMTSDFFLRQREQVKQFNEVTPIAQFGFLGDNGTIRRSSELPELPTLHELWSKHSSSGSQGPEYQLFAAYDNASGVQRLFVLPPETDERLREAWESALKQALHDPEYATLVSQQGGDEVVYADADETRARLAAIRTTFLDPEVLGVLGRIAPALRR